MSATSSNALEAPVLIPLQDIEFVPGVPFPDGCRLKAAPL